MCVDIGFAPLFLCNQCVCGDGEWESESSIGSERQRMESPNLLTVRRAMTCDTLRVLTCLFKLMWRIERIKLHEERYAEQ